MSRFEALDYKGRKFVYGFDRPLSYYFVDVVFPNGNWRHLVGLLSCPAVYGSAVNALECLDRYKVAIPDDHRAKLLGDLPI